MRRHVLQLLVIVVVLAPLVILGAIGWSAYYHGRPMVAALYEVQAAAATATQEPVPSLERAASQLRIARAEMDALRWFGDPLASLAGAMGNWPLVGLQAQQAAATWVFADHALAGAVALADAAESMLAAAGEGPQASGIVTVAPTIAGALRQAEYHLRGAQAARDQIRDPLPPFDRLAGPLAQWDLVVPQIRELMPTALALVDGLPQLLGADGPTTYLILAETNDDLRATGGFITSVGTIRLEGGALAAYNFQKVYGAEGLTGSTDQPPAGIGVAPPRPLEEYMGARVLLLRDANWWADFPTTARQARELWRQVQPTDVQGVVAFTEAGLESALQIVGSVTVDGQTVTAESLKDQTLTRVFAGTTTEAEWYERQSAFSQQLASAILAAAVQLSPDQMSGALPILREAIRRRDILATSVDPASAEIFSRLGLDGALRGGTDDYLYLVEQNVSYGKLSPFIEQRIQYAVEVEPSGRARTARLVVDRVNSFHQDRALPGYPDGYYWGLRWDPAAGQLSGELGAYGGYTRVLLPTASRILGASGFDGDPIADVEGGRTRLGGFTWLPMGTARRLLAEWLPAGQPSTDGVYRLVVQRQPGAPAHHVTVRATIVGDVQPSQVTPAPTEVEGATLTWTFDLDADREIVMDFRHRTPEGAKP